MLGLAGKVLKYSDSESAELATPSADDSMLELDDEGPKLIVVVALEVDDRSRI